MLQVMRNPFARRIWSLVAILITLQVVIVAAGVSGVFTIDTLRSYVVGETFYADAQKRATHALRRYAATGEAKYYRRYTEVMRGPRAFSLARIVLEHPEIPIRHARDFLERGGLSRGDAVLVSRFFRLFADTPFLKPAVETWRKADQIIVNLDSLALEVHAGHAGGIIGQARRGAFITRIDQLDDGITRLQRAFARQMGAASRSVRGLLIYGMLLLSMIVSAIGIMLGWRTSRRIAASERKLKESRQRFKDFADATSDWFWEMDENLRFSWFSERFRRVTGTRPEALLGKTREESGIPGVDEAEWQRHLEDLRVRRPFRNFEHPRYRPDGSVIWLSVNGKPIFDESGRFLGYRGSASDITERVENRKALERAKEAAETSAQAKAQFLANVSHELRTPLNAINGFSQMIRDQVLGALPDPRYREYAADIHNAGRHLLDLINDILDLSKLEAGHMQLDETDVDIYRDVLLPSQRLVAERAENAGIHVHIDAADDLGMVRADARKLKQIVINLLTNAIKYSPDGGTVAIAARHHGNGSMLIVVEDEGIGMTPDEAGIALEPFRQIEGHLSRKQEGTGLGLPLCRRLAELHGGFLEIRSRRGEGTTVRVHLPAECTRSADRQAVA